MRKLDKTGKRLILFLLTTLALLFTINIATAETVNTEKGIHLSGGSDIVSSYVWRGNYQAGVSFQPTLALNICGFSLIAWGSVDFASTDYKEMDLTAAYSLGPVTFSLADYYWSGSSKEHIQPDRNYFHFGATSPHMIEAGVSWRISERIPITLSWYTMLFGADRKEDGSQNYTSYMEIAYPFSIKGIDLNTGIGATPWGTSANVYGISSTKHFAVMNVFVGAAKSWEIKRMSSMSLGIFTNLIWNPSKEDINFVGGISFRM